MFGVAVGLVVDISFLSIFDNVPGFGAIGSALFDGVFVPGELVDEGELDEAVVIEGPGLVVLVDPPGCTLGTETKEGVELTPGRYAKVFVACKFGPI